LSGQAFVRQLARGGPAPLAQAALSLAVSAPADRAAEFALDATAAATPDLFGQAAALAGIDAFQCDLTDERLGWTAGVFDLFGLDSSHRLDRREMVTMYAEESRALLERLRARAIAERDGFTMEAEICRPSGERRWMRLTARVMCRDGRPAWLYGIKQDITEERSRWDALRRMAECDALTGLANRALFQNSFLDRPTAAPELAPLGALLLFDVDGFKQVNDRDGHAAGDACLREIARRLAAGFPDALMVARIGGDEFAVLARAGLPCEAIQAEAERALALLAQPVIWRDLYLKVGASAGIAAPSNPWVYNAEGLFIAADRALYTAKRVGRGTVRLARPGLERGLTGRLAQA
jgi:diguanylate cyclase (GGDEF)-like protein/PAS domain S-box-containing protein